jgi:hypothetical protein
MLNTVVTPSTEKPYLLAEEQFLIDEPLCGEVLPCKSKTCNAILCIKVYAYLLAGNIVKLLEMLLYR